MTKELKSIFKSLKSYLKKKTSVIQLHDNCKKNDGKLLK